MLKTPLFWKLRLLPESVGVEHPFVTRPRLATLPVLKEGGALEDDHRTGDQGRGEGIQRGWGCCRRGRGRAVRAAAVLRLVDELAAVEVPVDLAEVLLQPVQGDHGGGKHGHKDDLEKEVMETSTITAQFLALKSLNF